jgi:hypothetical protein
VTGGAPGYFIRHYSIPALIDFAESLSASGREWPDNATYNGGFIDQASRPERHRNASSAGPSAGTKPLPETVRQRGRARAHALLRRAEDHVALAIDRSEGRGVSPVSAAPRASRQRPVNGAPHSWRAQRCLARRASSTATRCLVSMREKEDVGRRQRRRPPKGRRTPALVPLTIGSWRERLVASAAARGRGSYTDPFDRTSPPIPLKGSTDSLPRRALVAPVVGGSTKM